MTKRKSQEEMTWLTARPRDVERVLGLIRSGLTDRQTAKEADTSHRTVAKCRQMHGLKPNGVTRQKLELIDEANARCSRCREVKPLADWPMAREGKKYPYRLSYCRDCRRRQVNLAQNKTELVNIKTRWMRLRVRCKRLGMVCTISLENLWNQWERQGGKCFYTDAIMLSDYGSGSSPLSLSLDKIEPRLGYIDGNVVLATRRANTIKHDMTLAEMALWMPGWHRRVIDFLTEGSF